MEGAPSPREAHPAVWTGSEMTVWGGSGGGRYDPAADSWAPLSDAGAPPGSGQMIWTGAAMLLWPGGTVDSGSRTTANGWLYNPVHDTWQAFPGLARLGPSIGNIVIWTGAQMLVWGGDDGSHVYGDGATYTPAP